MERSEAAAAVIGAAGAGAMAGTATTVADMVGAPTVAGLQGAYISSPGSEWGDGEDLEDIEIVVLGGAGEADACLDAASEGKVLERGPWSAVIEVLQHRETLDGCNREVGHAQLAARAHVERIGRETREGNAEVPAHADVTIGGTHTIVDGGTLLRRFAEAESQDWLGNPNKMNGAFTIVGLRRLDKENRLELSGRRLGRCASGLGTSHRGKCGQGEGAKSEGEKIPYMQEQEFR